MKMENRAVTFPQMRTILDGVNVPGVQLDDIQAILNMRDAEGLTDYLYDHAIQGIDMMPGEGWKTVPLLFILLRGGWVRLSRSGKRERRRAAF